MAELFIELFSEEIPARLQADARKKIKQILEEKLKKKDIDFKSSKSDIKKGKNQHIEGTIFSVSIY